MACHQKKAEQEGATIVWIDEAGFYLLPMAVRTWSPRGQTPVLRVPLTRDHLSAISGIPLDGRLFMQVRPASYDAAAVVRFLRVLLRKVAGKVIVIWDGSPIHRGEEKTSSSHFGFSVRSPSWWGSVVLQKNFTYRRIACLMHPWNIFS